MTRDQPKNHYYIQISHLEINSLNNFPNIVMNIVENYRRINISELNYHNTKHKLLTSHKRDSEVLSYHWSKKMFPKNDYHTNVTTCFYSTSTAYQVDQSGREDVVVGLVWTYHWSSVPSMDQPGL